MAVRVHPPPPTPYVPPASRRGLRSDDLEAAATTLGYTVEVYAPHERPPDGFCCYAERRIGIKRAAPNQQAAVEIQAEDAAYVACYALGLDAAAATLPNLKSYESTGDAREMAKKRTGRINAHPTAIDRIGWHLVELVEGLRDGAPVEVVSA